MKNNTTDQQSFHQLEVKNLHVSFNTDDGRVRAVDGVSYYIDEGEVVSFVGESGSGKTVSQLACMQLVASPPGKIDSGSVFLEGKDILKYNAKSSEMRSVRGGKIGMVFQEPMTSLNPVKTIGSQISEVVELHTEMTGAEARKRTIELLRDVGIPDAEKRINDYPFQFSGGMRQRIMVAMSIAGNPGIIIADEPTTALDVTTQAQILQLLKEATVDRGAGLLLVTHNLGIVARYSDRTYVMYAGRIVESGRSSDIFSHPSHPYTQALLAAVPRLDDRKGRRLSSIKSSTIGPGEIVEGCPFAPRCTHAISECRKGAPPKLIEAEGENHYTACIRPYSELESKTGDLSETVAAGADIDTGKTVLSVQNLRMAFPLESGFFRKKTGSLQVLDDVSFSIRAGETYGLVGESGCGKTTTARCITQLVTDYEGAINFADKNIAELSSRALKNERRRFQIIFQDPFSSLDPRQNAGDIVAEPLKIHKLVKSSKELNHRVDELFLQVGLTLNMKKRFVHEFSGGQRQRIGIARALACKPDLIVCDEPISALDVSIQAQIINLLIDIQRATGISYLFIAHDLAAVKHISDFISVMYLGNIVESAPAEKLYTEPMHPYTQVLLSAIPIPDPEVEKTREHTLIRGETPSLYNRPEGCTFHNRCIYATDICRKKKPQLLQREDNHSVACHLYT